MIPLPKKQAKKLALGAAVLMIIGLGILIVTPPNNTAKHPRASSILSPSVTSTSQTTNTAAPITRPTTSPSVRPTATSTAKPPALQPATPSLWRPKVGATFDWLEDSSLENLPASRRDIYIVDAFDVTAATIASLHKQGARVICYVNVGAWEDWRSDKNNFPESILGNDYEGWEGERWFDSTSPALKPLIQKRFDLAKQKGCDSIDADNMNSYEHATGFSITANDQIAYNIWLASEAHKRGMSIGLKNSAELMKRLLPSFDWALIEDCADQGWCADFRPFTAAGKAVFQVEYTDTGVSTATFCAEAKKNRFSAVLKHRNLDAWAEYCQE